jgi:hypothetical protein
VTHIALLAPPERKELERRARSRSLAVELLRKVILSSFLRDKQRIVK